MGDAEGVVFGMGRIGSSAYENLFKRYGKRVLGIDYDLEKVKEHIAQGLYVIQGDATDYDFWERVQIKKKEIKLVMLAMPNFEANMYAAKRMRARGADVIIAAVAAFDDQIEMLQEAGGDLAFNVSKEAGKGFADHICEQLGQQEHSVSYPQG